MPSPEDEPPSRWSRLHKANFNSLGKMEFLPTRFLASDFLEELGIREHLMGYLEEMGLGMLSQMDHFSYPGLTRQFLATLDVIFPPRRTRASKCELTFKIDNTSYKLDAEKVCQAYGFRNYTFAKFPKFNDATLFWNRIGDNGNFEGGRSLASSLRNPVIWMAHRFLTQTIFPRHDISRVKSDELCLLFQGMSMTVLRPDGCHFEDPFTTHINIGAVFMWELGQHAKWAISTPVAKPSTSIGGMLVPLFIKAGVPLSAHYNDPRRFYIDHASLLPSHTLKPELENGRYVYIFKDAQRNNRKFLLPNRELTSVRLGRHIAFRYGELLEPEESEEDDEDEAGDDDEMETEQQQHEPQPQQQTTSHQVPTLESLFRNIQLRPIPFEPENEHERWFAEEHERQRRFNTIAMNLFSEYDRITGRLNQPSPAISGFSEFDDSNNDGEDQGGPSSPH